MLVLAAAAGPALGQDAVLHRAEAQVQSLDRAAAEEERLRAAGALRQDGYVDKVMDPRDLPALAADADETPDTRGFRAWSVETRAGAAKAEGLQLRSATELGQSFRYQHQTTNHGAFQVEADWRHGPDSPEFAVGSVSAAGRRNTARLTVRNYGFPLTPRTFLDSAVGDIYSDVTQVLGRMSRLSVGASVLRGVSTRMAGEGFELRGGTGVRGVFAGSPYPGFERTRGTLTWAGGSMNVDESLSVGVQVNHAEDVPAFNTVFPLSARGEDVDSVAAGLAWTPPGDASQPRARLVHLRSRSNRAAAGLDRDAQGWTAEGGFSLGDFRHELGAYQADANLRFGDYTLGISDGYGAFWRVDTAGITSTWSLGVDYDFLDAEPLTGGAASRHVGLNGGGQYRLGRWDSVGGFASLGFTRYSGGTVPGWLEGVHRSISANVYYQTRFGGFAPTRLRASIFRNERLVANDVPATGEELAWEQEWLQGADDDLQRPEFTTTLGVARDRSGGRTEIQPTAGATFRLRPQPDWSLTGTLRYTARDSNLSTSRGLSGTVSSEKQLADGWRLGASMSLNQAVVRLPLAGAADPEVVRSNDRSVSVYVRWEGVAGSTLQGVGLREAGTAGAGSVGGIVFLDADQDGRQSLNEPGASGVEVILDGRFRVVTDRFGRFDFPLVATGRHQLALTAETVPLPWGVPRSQDVRVEVPLRGEAFVRIPVVRTGD